MELHEKLQQLRKEKGWTQEELAEMLYVSRTAISKWESKGGHAPFGTRFCLQSLVCYTLYLWDCEKSGIGIRVVDFEADKKSFISVPVSVTEVRLFD